MEAEDKPHDLIPAVIDEVSDGVTEIVPVLQKNLIGVLLLITLLSTSTLCAVAFITTWNDNSPFNQPHGSSH